MNDMPIFACGVNHKTASLDLREKVIFTQDKIALYLNDLVTQENIHEAVILSTCNRSELYCSANNVNQVVDWFCRQHAIARDILEPALYIYEDQLAVEHMMSVASGLDSMVLGESQILGQMKDAFSEACAAGAVGPLFNRLFQQIFSIVKEVRTNTAIGACPVSVSSAAVNFIKNNYSEPLAHANLLLVGAGVTAELVLRHLKNDTLNKIMIANRSIENASKLVEQYSGEAVHLNELEQAIFRADLMITATGGATPIITQSLMATRHKPLLIVDIAVPRDVESSIAALSHVRLFTIDDLKESIQQNLQGREHAALKASEIIKQKSHAFMIWLNSFDMVGTTIRAYRKQIEDLCQAELTKAIRQLHRGEEAVRVMQEFAQALTNKLLHTPSVQLRQAGYEGRLDILQLAQQLFAIQELKTEVI